MTESSDDIIVLSDEDEEIKIESIVSAKISKPINKSRACATRINTSLKSTIQNRAPTLILTEPKSISYGIERGYKLKRILGVKRLTTEKQLLYLVEYELCDDYEFVPSNILHQYCNEDILIEYLEKLTHFTD
ncbi:unnamed protein product [Rotaria magnacalcarata]|uniref:Uncharacterized protein n=1 Tax=Rotaria magnacalcarata TaxID=392030 RepID=A0A814MWZ4_9BILA|nr:unnamed protein product [Rotaria magnacalcarata]CAF1639172.1 unnamed protein product [Rotaria magnacalcarata]CAF1938981.1 unnamed protein product [Rotaria magnacalcarata]CAF3800637.1 unnamed protein product [Rotaria magnacalcarata]CAF3817642.1 unnamed protein product [Rotaria magnacalcarata]